MGINENEFLKEGVFFYFQNLEYSRFFKSVRYIEYNIESFILKIINVEEKILFYFYF